MLVLSVIGVLNFTEYLLAFSVIGVCIKFIYEVCFVFLVLCTNKFQVLLAIHANKVILLSVASIACNIGDNFVLLPILLAIHANIIN